MRVYPNIDEMSFRVTQMKIGEDMKAAQEVSEDIPEESYENLKDVADVFLFLVQDNDVPMPHAKELVKYKYRTEHESGSEITIDELVDRCSNKDTNETSEQEVEPIKASTLSQFEWCPVESFIEHLKEIGDDRVPSTSKSSDALQAGEALHGNSFGLRVRVMEEDTGETIVEKMAAERVTAINHGDYQIQGAPDEVQIDGDTVRVVDMKTTGWDDRAPYEEHQLPPSAFQVQIYSWMLSHAPDVTVLNPRVAVKQRENGTATDWFTEEVEFDRDETEEKIERVLSLFESPTELPERRPDEDWKCKNDDHWQQFVNSVVFDE